MMALFLQHQVLMAAESKLDWFLGEAAYEFVHHKVLEFLQDSTISWTMFEALIDALSEIEKEVLSAQNINLQLVGIGDNWDKADSICSRFRELKVMLMDMLLGAIEGRPSLQSLLNIGALQCLKWGF